MSIIIMTTQAMLQPLVWASIGALSVCVVVLLYRVMRTLLFPPDKTDGDIQERRSPEPFASNEEKEEEEEEDEDEDEEKERQKRAERTLEALARNVEEERQAELFEARRLMERKPPEVQRLNQLADTFVITDGVNGIPSCRWDHLVAIGDIYAKGAFPRFLPDPDMAMECYRVGAMCPDGHIAGMSQVKYIETRTTDIPDEDKAGATFPDDPGLRVCTDARQVIAATPMQMFEKPHQIKGIENRNENAAAVPSATATTAATTAATTVATTIPTTPRDTYDPTAYVDGMAVGYNEILPAHMVEELLREPVQYDRDVQNEANIPAYRHDRQNVHDHGISTVTDHNLRALLTCNTKDKRDAPATDTVRSHIANCTDLDDRTKHDALRVLDGLSKSTHSTFGTSEREALDAVWKEIKASENKDNLVETLAKQLASGIENGHTVCSSGKIARIVSTLDGTSNQSVPRPMWAVREEIAALASRVRDEYGAADGYADEDLARNEFAKRVRTSYVEGLGMSSTIIEPIVQEYSAGF